MNTFITRGLLVLLLFLSTNTLYSQPCPTPANFGISQFNNSVVTFTWDEVTQADEYLFYVENLNGETLTIEATQNTYYDVDLMEYEYTTLVTYVVSVCSPTIQSAPTGPITLPTIADVIRSANTCTQPGPTIGVVASSNHIAIGLDCYCDTEAELEEFYNELYGQRPTNASCKTHQLNPYPNILCTCPNENGITSFHGSTQSAYLQRIYERQELEAALCKQNCGTQGGSCVVCDGGTHSRISPISNIKHAYSNDILKITLPESEEEIILARLVNVVNLQEYAVINGQTVLKQREIEYSTSLVPQGIYILQIQTENQVYSKKVWIE